MEAISKPGFRPLSRGMRLLLLVAGGLVFLAGFQLFVLTQQTDRFFAWTIQPSLTAAFLGAGYWASFLLEVLAAREKAWARARIAVPAVFTFTTLTLIATLLHLDRFHFNSPNPIAQTAAYLWLAIYLIVPIGMLVFLLAQLRVPGSDPPRTLALPIWMVVALGLQGAIMLGTGVALFVAPQLVATIWPWKLTPLTGRAIGAWLIGVGVFAAHMAWENDFTRTKAGMISYTAFAALELLAIGRYPSDLNWANLGTWLYIFLILSVMLVGIYGLTKRAVLRV
jgi:hypothetical protein